MRDSVLSARELATSAKRNKLLLSLALLLVLAAMLLSSLLLYAEIGSASLDLTESSVRSPDRASPQRPTPSSESAAVTQPRRGAGAELTEEASLAKLRELSQRDPLATLALAERQARRFPEGRHRQELEEHAIRALFRLDRIADARSRAQRFLIEHPHGVVAERVAALSGVHVNP
jgi:hypothetical protein